MKRIEEAILRNAKSKKHLFSGTLLGLLLSACYVQPVFATNSAASIVSPLLNQFISIIGFIFVVVGIFILVYGAFQLIFSMLNDDPDSKGRAAKLIAVGAVAIVFPMIISGLNLTQYLTNL